MGITGLLPFLKKIHEPVNVSRFSGCTVAIDAYCWLHKGAFSCAEKLALGEKTDQYVYYCMKFINYLLSHNIKPVMVFDGCHLPSKKLVEKSRREKREANRKKAALFLREGRRAEARECLQRCIDISPEMALNLMNVCRDKGVDCIVAPYEADAQLAYLNKIGVADVIITEDSDLLLFGCEKVLFKMDHAGNGLLIEKRRLNEVAEIQTDSYTFDKFRYMCIMSGCDYLASLPGIGLARANKVFKIARQADMTQLLKKLSTYLKSNITVPQEYIDGFVQADNTFLYQLVYDPLQRKLLPLTPYPPDINPKDLTYAGEYVSQERALQIALGNINIYSGDRFANFDPETFVPKYAKKKPDYLYLRSMWDKHYRIKPKAVLHEAQPSDRPVLKGKEITIKSNFKKRSPKKREREVEDGQDVKTDTELYSMYNESSPTKKKNRTDDMDDDLQRFMYTDKVKGGNQSEEEDEEDNEEPALPAQPKFFNSLSKAHPDVTDLNQAQEDEANKENGLLSPKRNVFASKSPGKKPRFDLNASKSPAKKSKEIKSRFFASASKKDSNSKSPIKNNSDMSILGYKLIHHSNTNTPENKLTTHSPESGETEGSEGADKTLKEPNLPFSFSKSASDLKTSQTASPGSAFRWSKFNFSKKSNSAVSSPINSRKVNKDFKKVVSESKLDEFLKNKSKEDSFEKSIGKGSETSVDKDERNDEVTSPSLAAESDSGIGPGLILSESASSLPCSIDSYCMNSQVSDVSSTFGASQESVESNNSVQQRGLSIYSFKPAQNTQSDSSFCSVKSANENKDSIENDLQENQTTSEHSKFFSDQKDKEEKVVFLIDSEDEETLGSSSSKDKQQKTIQKTQSKGSSKAGCRVSGLSKRSNKKSPAVDSKQQSLKDMFSRFAKTTSSKPRLSHCEEIDLESTPVGVTNLMQKSEASKLQRKLLK